MGSHDLTVFSEYGKEEQKIWKYNHFYYKKCNMSTLASLKSCNTTWERCRYLTHSYPGSLMLSALALQFAAVYTTTLNIEHNLCGRFFSNILCPTSNLASDAWETVILWNTLYREMFSSYPCNAQNNENIHLF